VAANFVNGSEINEQTLLRTFQGCFLQNFDSFGLAVTENFFLEINQSETRFLPVAAMFVSSPYQRQRELLPSLGICRPLTFHILIFSSETPQPKEVKLP
jgi:hypothetical protein